MVWYNVFTYSGQIEQILFYFTETNVIKNNGFQAGTENLLFLCMTWRSNLFLERQRWVGKCFWFLWLWPPDYNLLLCWSSKQRWSSTVYLTETWTLNPCFEQGLIRLWELCQGGRGVGRLQHHWGVQSPTSLLWVWLGVAAELMPFALPPAALTTAETLWM